MSTHCFKSNHQHRHHNAHSSCSWIRKQKNNNKKMQEKNPWLGINSYLAFAATLWMSHSESVSSTWVMQCTSIHVLLPLWWRIMLRFVFLHSVCLDKIKRILSIFGTNGGGIPNENNVLVYIECAIEQNTIKCYKNRAFTVIFYSATNGNISLKTFI